MSFTPANKNNFVGRGYVTSQSQINDILKEHEEIAPENITTGMYLKNINLKDGGLRTGGYVKSKSDEYVILTNNEKHWPVKIENNTFYKKNIIAPVASDEIDIHDMVEFMIGSSEYNIMRIQVNNKGSWKNVSWTEFERFYKKNKHKKLW